MEKLGRLGWVAELSFDAFGLRIGIRASDAGLLDACRRLLPPGVKIQSHAPVERIYSIITAGPRADNKTRRLHLLYANVEQLARTASFSDLLESFRSDVNLYVAQYARELLFVHAGAVGWKGHAIVIPGRSLSGKTTLVREFLLAGATYYSDEFVLLDRRGFVHPFASALRVRGANSDRQELRPPQEFGSSAGVTPLPVGSVIATQYRVGARWKPRAISKGLGILALLANTAAARKEPSRALAVLSRAMADAYILKGSRGEAKDVVQFVLDELEKREEPNAGFRKSSLFHTRTKKELPRSGGV